MLVTLKNEFNYEIKWQTGMLSWITILLKKYYHWRNLFGVVNDLASQNLILRKRVKDKIKSLIIFYFKDKIKSLVRFVLTIYVVIKD